MEILISQPMHCLNALVKCTVLNIIYFTENIDRRFQVLCWSLPNLNISRYLYDDGW